MLQVSHLTRRFGAETVLDDISFAIDAGEHTGLVGPNGSGKTTLLRCIAGRDRPDHGTVTVPAGAAVGYLSQALEEVAGRTVGDALAGEGPFAAASRALAEAEAALGRRETGAAAADRYADALARFEGLGGYAREAEQAAIAAALGLAGLEPASEADELSGGQKTRVALACLLGQRPDILLLDEPTNHLDLEALEWLEGFVLAFPGAALVVSHDREFLDRTATTILALDGRTHRLRAFAGNYSDYARALAAEREAQAEAWRRQEEYVARVRRDIAEKKSGALAIERSTTPRQPGVRRLARKKAALAKARERKLERYLESDERVDRPRRDWSLKLGFGSRDTAGREAIRLERVDARYGDGPAVLAGVSVSVKHGDRVVVRGPNGSGKTTLLRLIDGSLEPAAGTAWRSPNVRLGVITQEQERLDPGDRVIDVARRARPMDETDARTFLHQFLFSGDAAFKLVGRCSPGERARLQLARLVLSGCNVLVLDEPLNHLDIDGREHFESALDAFDGAVIAVSHDRAFVRRFARRLFDVAGGRVASREAGAEP